MSTGVWYTNIELLQSAFKHTYRTIELYPQITQAPETPGHQQKNEKRRGKDRKHSTKSRLQPVYDIPISHLLFNQETHQCIHIKLNCINKQDNHMYETETRSRFGTSYNNERSGIWMFFYETSSRSNQNKIVKRLVVCHVSGLGLELTRTQFNSNS
mgnify:CR=1 FL=1